MTDITELQEPDYIIVIDLLLIKFIDALVLKSAIITSLM